MKKLSKKAATLVGETLTELQYDGSSCIGYVCSTACGGGADF